MTYNHNQLLQALDNILSARPRSTLSDLARTLRVERHSIENAVRKSQGMSFRLYRAKKLLECSLYLLRQEAGLSEKEIATRIGFSSDAAFCRFIKRETGQTPTSLRQIWSADHTAGKTCHNG